MYPQAGIKQAAGGIAAKVGEPNRPKALRSEGHLPLAGSYMTQTSDLTVRSESRLLWIREQIEEQYAANPIGCGVSFDELLCYELHHGAEDGGLTFRWLAEKWGISLPTLGELIHDHCKR